MKKRAPLRPDRIETNVGPLLLAGIGKKYITGISMDPGALWLQFTPYLGYIPGQKGKFAYGLCRDLYRGQGIEYFCGVEVSNVECLPSVMEHKSLGRNNYAVFSHIGHVTTIHRTCELIWKEWVPEFYSSKDPCIDFFFERYGEGFNSKKGIGDIEIWIPVKFN